MAINPIGAAVAQSGASNQASERYNNLVDQRNAAEASKEASASETKRDVTQQEATGRSKSVNDTLSNIHTSELDISVHDELQKTIVKVKNNETDELIRQIPLEEQVRIAENIQNYQDGAAEPVGMHLDKFV